MSFFPLFLFLRRDRLGFVASASASNSRLTRAEKNSERGNSVKFLPLGPRFVSSFSRQSAFTARVDRAFKAGPRSRRAWYSSGTRSITLARRIRGWFRRSRVTHPRHWPVDAVKLDSTTALGPSIRPFPVAARINASSRVTLEETSHCRRLWPDAIGRSSVNSPGVHPFVGPRPFFSTWRRGRRSRRLRGIALNIPRRHPRIIQRSSPHPSEASALRLISRHPFNRDRARLRS